ncbi:MAG: Holliday junction branch migration protein RuvA [Alphaproteobacteria bacterium]|nr:Holliday junction branch migration protein RuvA [Alphaproteobacteria bacterium]
MIAKLTGILDSLYDGFLILDVNGVGYRVFCSNRTLSMMPGKGMSCALLIETQVREDHIHLFGFADNAEKEWFNVLTDVQGVGAKVALAILSALSPNDLSMAIATGDAKTFTRASGVGPKLATRLVTELKGKDLMTGVSLDIPSTIAGAGGTSNVVQEAISALVNLGYGRSEAGMIVGTVYKDNENANISDLIRLSLKEIGKKNG